MRIVTRIMGTLKLVRFFMLFFAMSEIACRRSPSLQSGESIPVTKLLHRSSTASWEAKQSISTGLQVEVPTDLCRFAEDPGVGVVIKLHTVPPPRDVLDDKKCLLEIDVERMTHDDFVTQRATDPSAPRGGDNPKLRRWTYQRHDSISRFDEGGYTYYRYDIECSNGDIVSTLTNVINVYERGVSLYEKEDDAIVRRILGSLRCFDRRR